MFRRLFVALAFPFVVAYAALSGSAWAVPFTPGNIVVYRLGDGSGALSSAGTAVFLDEYTPAGSLVQSIPLPTAVSGSNRRIVASGTATTDGFLNRSTDGRYLLATGYDAGVGTVGVATSASGTVNRVVGRVASDAVVDSSTALSDASTGGNFRSAVSVDGSAFWTSGSVGGIRYATLGATTSTSISTTVANVRGIGIGGSQLYMSSGSGTIRLGAVGSGLPTTTGQAVAALPGIPTAAGGFNQFFAADLDAGVAGVDTIYVADDAGNAITKFSLVAGTWTPSGSITGNAYRGLTGAVSGGSVTIYASRAGTSGSTDLVSFVDNSGYNGTLSATPTVLANSGSTKGFRGVALAPVQLITVTPSAGANGTISPSTPQQYQLGLAATFTATPDSGYSAVFGGTCGGTPTGNTYVTNVLSAACSVSVTFSMVPTYTVTPSATVGGTINPNTPVTVLSGATTSFTVTPASGYSMSVGGTCGGNLAGNTYTTNAIIANCSVDATFTLITYTVTPSATANGTITPSMAQVVASGATTVFTLAPDAGYFATVAGSCGGTLTGNTYTTNAIVANCSVDATFTQLPIYTVTPSASANGSITPSTPQPVVSGSTTTFTVAPNAGYSVAMRGTCGGTLSGGVYTTKAITANCTVTATFAKKVVLFLGNSYTFGRIDPVMSYNAVNVTDLTLVPWQLNPTGTNADEPHPWGGIPGVFKKLTDQAGLEYDVSISARNAASLRGHYLNSANQPFWDLRGNAASQKWSTIVLQDLSDEPLPAGRGANANLPYFNAYADKFEAWVHVGAAESYTETTLFGGGSTATCVSVTGASTGTCDLVRNITPANSNASAATDVYLYQTWARPDMIAPNGTNLNGATPWYTQAEGLELMTSHFHDGYFGRAAANANYKAVNPVGDAFLRAVTSGVATRDPYLPDGKINLWHTDYFHPSKYGSYLSALVHFAMISGISPTTLGAGELAAIDLGISSADAVALQQVARDTVVPAAPAIGAATGGNGQVTVSFTPASNVGGLAITGYTATCGAQTSTGAASPIVVSGLANGTPVTCTVAASNSVGTGAASATSNTTTPSIAVLITSGAPGNGTVGVAYSATVAASGSPTPTFSVSAGALPAGLTLNTMSGLVSGTPTTFGTFTGTIQASNGVSSDVQNFSIAIAQGTQTITFATLPGKILGDPAFNVSATASSTLTVSFTSQTPAVCTATGINGSTITLIAAGNCTIAADQPGDANYASAAQVSRTFGVASSSQCISLTTSGVAYTQNFDTLANTGTSSTLPLGWKLFETGTTADTTYGTGNGSSTSGNTYSFGANASTERAFGTLQSGSLIPTIGACFTNDTGATLASLAISYVGEQWRLGAAGRADRLDFQYSLDATSVSSSSTWIDINALDFSTPNTTAAVGAIDGNAVGNKTAISSTISSLSIPPGATVWIRWTDLNPSGSDDGLAIDDFSLTPVVLVVQPDLTINDVSQVEGNAGTTAFTFTVSLSAPAGAGGVTFDIATANGTASAGSDYVAKTLLAQTIPQGMTSYTFTVDVNGDTTTEPDETFFVNVTNLSGANNIHGQGVGTILNDDAGVTLTINNVSQVEGNSGTSIFAFTVNLSGPAPAGGVTFDIATSNGTATAGSDYVAQSLVGEAIPAGATSYTFNVVVNGDTDVEPDETFFVTLSNVSGATAPNTQAKGTILTDDIIRIHTLQGTGNTSPFNGQPVTVEGIVTADYQGLNQLKGFFIQEPDNLADADPLTSEGVFVFTNATPVAVSVGQLVRVTGTVSEFGTAPNTLTEIGTPTLSPVVAVVSSNNPLPAFTTITLPIATAGDLERYEGMRVRISQPMAVSDHFTLAQFGTLTLTAGGRALQPTNEVDLNDNPASGTNSSGNSNSAAVAAFDNLNLRSSINLDDGSSTVYPATIPYLDPVTHTIRLGTTVSNITGVLSQAGGVHAIHPDVPPVFTYAPRPLTPPAVGGNLKVASANVLNYFNGNGSNVEGAAGGFPTARGANTYAEFQRQRAKTISAISGINADVIGLLEMENDGTGPLSAVQDLVNGVNGVLGVGTYAIIPDPAGYGSTPGGTDAIRPVIIYKPAVVAPVGASATYIDTAFNNARSPVAQTFRLLVNNEQFTYVLNHFKSKGSGGTGLDADQGDGQAFYNNTRKLEAVALLSFIGNLTASGPARLITMGDFNAYEQEDPIDVLRAGGLSTILNNDTSYMFNGLSGSLDHALGTPALISSISGAGHWHINADEPVILDYNVENKNTLGCNNLVTCTSQDFYDTSAFRASDHDPVLVGLQLVATQCLAGTFSATGNAPCTPASPGNFVALPGAMTQTQCLVGTFQNASGASQCIPASAGSFVNLPGATTQAPCNAGSYQPATGSSACIPADPGSFVAMNGATTQTACVVGSFQANPGSISCNPAPAGSYVGTPGATAPTPCTAGSFQPLTSQSSCNLAQPGFFVPGSGAISQTMCAAGTTTLVNGATSCVPITFNVTSSAGANGSISPLGVQAIAQGMTTTFTVTPAAGFTASVVSTCGGSLSANMFTTAAITADCSVTASFATTLALVAVQSRKIHGATPYDITVTAGAPIVVEPRVIGGGHTIVFQFNVPITVAGAVSATNSVPASISGVTSTNSGNDVVVTIPTLANNQRVTISLTGVNGSGSFNARMGFLVGDVNGNGAVDSADVSAVKTRSGQTTTLSNFRFDVNASGSINASDISAVKSRVNSVLVP